VIIGVVIPFSPIGRYLGFSSQPPLYWPLLVLAADLLCDMLLTQGVTMWLLRRSPI
jgi:hypothetical protein